MADEDTNNDYALQDTNLETTPQHTPKMPPEEALQSMLGTIQTTDEDIPQPQQPSFHSARKVRALQKTELLYSSVLYAINILIFASLVLLLRDGSTSYFGRVMDFSFLPKGPVNLQKDVWNYISGDLISILPDTGLDNQTVSLQEAVILLGNIQINQYRKNAVPCTYNFFPTMVCVGSSYNGSAFGPTNITKLGFSSVSFWATIGSYSGAYNTVFLPNSKSSALNVINQLQNFPWFDKQTDVIQIVIYSYIPTINTFGQYLVVFERTRAGYWISSTDFSTFVVPNTSIIVVFVFYLISMLIYQINFFRKLIVNILNLGLLNSIIKYFFTLGWEFVTTLYFSVHLAIITVICLYFSKIYTFVDSLDSTTTYEYSRLSSLFSLSLLLFILTVFALSVIVLKSMHYFEINSYTSITFNTILMASPHLFALIIVLLTIWFSFAVAGTLLFAPKSLLFRQILISFLSSWDMLTGNLGMISFINLTPVLGPIYYIFFTVVMTFVLLNMFIGLIVEFYNENMKQREYNVSLSTKNLPFMEKLKRNMSRYMDYLLDKEMGPLSIHEAVDFLAYKTFTKLTLDQFVRQLKELGVEDRVDWQDHYATFLEIRRKRDLAGLETGDILTLWNLIESKIDLLIAHKRSQSSLSGQRKKDI